MVISAPANALVPAVPVQEVITKVTEGFFTVQSKITLQIGGMSVTHPQAIHENTNTINAAIMAATEQRALSAKIEAENDKQLKQVLAANYQAAKTQSNLAEKLLDYSEYGQGYNPCLVKSENAVMDVAFKELRTILLISKHAGQFAWSIS